MQPESHHLTERLVEAYNRMLERARHALERVTAHEPELHQLLEDAKAKAVEEGELSHEEAEQIARYVQRDVRDAATGMRAERSEFQEWLRFDVELVEERLAEIFSRMADHTQVELDRLAEEANVQGWEAGEVTSLGTLQCVDCGHEIHFHKTSHVPHCPKCDGKLFRRPRTH
jgi:rubrerythrin